MITKEQLQKFIDKNADRVAEVCSGGLKDARGKWILVCPVIERFDLDFSKIGAKPAKVEVPVEEVVEEQPKKSTKKKSKKSKK